MSKIQCLVKLSFNKTILQPFKTKSKNYHSPKCEHFFTFCPNAHILSKCESFLPFSPKCESFFKLFLSPRRESFLPFLQHSFMSLKLKLKTSLTYHCIMRIRMHKIAKFGEPNDKKTQKNSLSSFSFSNNKEASKHHGNIRLQD